MRETEQEKAIRLPRRQKFWRCPKCKKACTTVQIADDRYKAIYSECCLVKNPPERE
jgi:hypothetical protein